MEASQNIKTIAEDGRTVKKGGGVAKMKTDGLSEW